MSDESGKASRRWRRDYPYCLQWEAVLEYYEHTCLRCGRRGEVTRDHVIPLSKGGENRLTNLQPLCEACNGEKGTMSTDYRDSYLHLRLLEALCEEGLL